ncbi:MAG: hypothetical protein ACRBDL_08865 [Alphaproteobacteria bacterium]
MSRSKHSDIILNIDGLNQSENHLKTPFESSHNQMQAIDTALKLIVQRLAQEAADIDFKAIYEARQAHQSDNKGGT